MVHRPVSNPAAVLLAGGDAKGASKAAATAWGELVKGLRRRGPAAKGDASLSAALSRLTDAQGERQYCPVRLSQRVPHAPPLHGAQRTFSTLKLAGHRESDTCQ